MIEAKIIADSVAPSGVRLTTMELRYPRFIHSEFMTHRVFSRNASSSRAIPIQRMIEQVRSGPATPIHWGKNQAGMQAGEELQIDNKKFASYNWIMAAMDAIHRAEALNKVEVHKQVVNRLLEPFQHITVVVTATEWDNFFNLRDHEDAQPEIQALARAMGEAMWESVPKILKLGEWHTPYALETDSLEERIKTSVAGCARVSYNTHDGESRTVEKDLILYDQLLFAGHMSPFEHQATPMDCEGYIAYLLPSGVTHMDRDGDYWSGNFLEWIQNRQLL